MITNVVYKTQLQNLKNLTKEEFERIKFFCHISKNLYNVALYETNQFYEKENKFLNYNSNYHLCKTNENYKLLQSNISQNILKEIESNFKTFYSNMKNFKCGKIQDKPNTPHYLKKDSYFKLIIPVTGSTIQNNYFHVPFSYKYMSMFNKNKKSLKDRIKIKIPSNLAEKEIVQVEIIPKQNGKYFQVAFTYKEKIINPIIEQNNNSLSIDLGINNLASCIDTQGNSFLIDGKYLKSVNQFYNKQISKLQSIKDLQKIKGYTNKMFLITQKRNRRVKDYMNKSVAFIIKYCLKNNISNVICGYNKGWKNEINLGKINNQKFYGIPHFQFKEKLKYKCELNGISFIEQEESYTSQASFIDQDDIPVYKNDSNDQKAPYAFSGKRVKRGLYKTKEGKLINADLNGAANILNKSKQIFNYELLCSGLMLNPLRIKILDLNSK